MKDSKQLEKIFKALGEENRLKILSCILRNELKCHQGKNCNMDVCMKDFSKPLKISFATISHHVKELVNADLITTKKEGRWVYCQINKKEFKKAQKFLSDLSNDEIKKEGGDNK
ncbi:MAG: metalloregulator ArsR/SmtB family transcription factor [Candidatus Levyibacteriota bacterium]